ncbi:carbamoyltransferase C-terminal domain-containing protein [Streptomyces sp. NPDC096097]|uniref:carbamoyltransferase C-terminal domain-containing protein n=1 Tax=Streptomyces sp. NPDC096097 TaxID=3155546 RepID=UPI003320BAE6
MADRHDVEYFLSGYLTPPGPTAVLSARHDQNVALWRRGGRAVELVRVWELERVSGQKHHHQPLYTPARAEAFLNGLLATEGLDLSDISASWGTPGLPGHAEIPVPAGAEDFPLHSLGHLFSGLLMDSALFKRETIIAMAVDGGPDFVQDRGTRSAWYAGCVSVQGRPAFAPVESPGPLYTAAETIFGKEPGTLMALASACRTRIDLDVEAVMAGVELFGGRRAPWQDAHRVVASIVSEARRQLAGKEPDREFTDEENLQSAVMEVVQRCCELVAVRNIERLLAIGGVRAEDAYLSTSGGFALNCPANSLLMDRFGFKGLLTPPCANDSGQALGLGLLALYGTGALDGADILIESAYHGNELRDVDAALAEFAPWIEEVGDFSPERFAEDLDDSVVAWVDGAAEIGPRALGHRSLLGDPRSTKVKDLLNAYKQRQWWRPVAPIVAAEYAPDWFDGDRPSPYMLETVQVRPEVRDAVPAIVHLDGSARHQVLTAAANPLLHRAIGAFHARTGVPIVCNTSLNDRGEPVVDTAAEALVFCIRKGLRIAYLGGRRIVLRAAPVPDTAPPSAPRERSTAYFAGQEQDRDALWQGWLDAGYTEEGMFLLSRSPDLRAELGSSTVERVNALGAYEAAAGPGHALMVRRFRTAHGPEASSDR